MSTTAQVSIPGGHIRTRVEGGERADRPWLVLSHSLAASHTMWDAQIPALTARYRVLRYDTRGHGASSAPPGPYGFDDLVADAVAVMDAHGVGRAAFMGLSLGEMTGLGLALAHPGRVERLACCAARADAPAPFVTGWDERVAIVAQGGTAALAEPTVVRWLTERTRRTRPDAAVGLAAGIRATSAEGYRGCAEALKRLDYLKDLPGLAVPTLYVAGAQDASAPPEAMRAMAQVTPGAELAVVPDAAHIINVDAPEAFEAALRGFLL